MTVKSPFYNKPSTATSVDSCHKCPLEPATETQDSTAVPASVFEKVQPQRAGVEQPQVTGPSSSNNQQQQQPVAEPCSSSAARTDIGNASVTSCSNCGTTTTPLWRRSPQGETICNACGLYLKARNTTRPPWLKRNTTKRPTPSAPVALAPAPPAAVTTRCIAPKPSNPCDKCTGICECHRPVLSCANCNTTTTPLWRRDEQGNTICNACGLYFKLHNVHRPVTMKRSTIKRRKRVSTFSNFASSALSQSGYTSSDYSDSSERRKRKINHADIRPSKRVELPLLAAKVPIRPLLPNVRLPPNNNNAVAENVPPLNAVEPDAFQKHIPTQLPSPPMKPACGKSSDIARLLNPSNDDDNVKESRSLPSISLPSLPSPPLSAHEMPPLIKDHQQQKPSSTVAAAAALATVSALLNPTANPQRTQQMLEAHRCELQREVTNLTSMLSRTTAMLQNLDQVMAVTAKEEPKDEGVTNALASLFALATAATNAHRHPLDTRV